jgi:hypothetical protein
MDALKCHEKNFKIVGIVRVGSGTGSGTFCRSSRIRIQIRIQNSEENWIRIRKKIVSTTLVSTL